MLIVAFLFSVIGIKKFQIRNAKKNNKYWRNWRYKGDEKAWIITDKHKIAWESKIILHEKKDTRYWKNHFSYNWDVANQPFVTFGWYPSTEAFGINKEYACDKDIIAIICRTDNTLFLILNYLVFLEFKVLLWREKTGNRQGLWQGGRMELLQSRECEIRSNKE